MNKKQNRIKQLDEEYAKIYDRIINLDDTIDFDDAERKTERELRKFKRLRIINPKTGRYILKTSPLAKTIMKQRRLIKEEKEEKEEKQREEKQREEKVNVDLSAEYRNKLFNNDDLNEGFKIIQNRKLQNDEVLKIKQLIRGIGEKALFNIVMQNGETKSLTLNKENIDILLKLLVERGIKTESRINVGSDAMTEIFFIGIRSVKVEKLKNKNMLRSYNGLYFNKTNNTDIDLTKYQIYKEMKDNDEHCLIHTLRLCGISEDLLCSVKSHFQKDEYIDKKALYKIAQIINHDIVLHQLFTTNGQAKPHKIIYNGTNPNNPQINICLYNEHYFIYDMLNYTTFSINNYDKLKDIENYNNIYKILKNKKNGENKEYYLRKDKKMNSLRLIQLLDKNNHFKNFGLNLTCEKTIETKYSIDNIENEQRLYKYESKENNNNIVFFADIESDTSNVHEPLLIGISRYDLEYICAVKIYRRMDDAQKMIFNALDYIIKNSMDKNIIVYFHNLKYDLSLLSNYVNLINIREKDSIIYSADIVYRKRIIHFRDSYKLLPMPLSNFKNTFQLDIGKQEAIAYNYYKIHNQDVNIIKLRDYEKYLKDDDILIFRDNIKNNHFEFDYDVKNDTFNPWYYYIYYLQHDVYTLKEGFSKFSNIINEITNNKMDIYNYLTISSLTNGYFGLNGAFDGVYEVTGTIRDFISASIRGGRVHVNYKFEKKEINNKISNFDGVSLYASGIHRLCNEYGLPLGKAKKIKDFNKDDNYYIIEIKVTKINKYQQIPTVCHKIDNEIKYINELPKCGYIQVVIDKYTLEDWINYQHIEYEFIQGVYWNDGYNNSMGKITEALFNDRLKYKNTEKKAMADILKLMLVSSYGKTIIKKVNVKKEIININNEKKYNDKICKDYNIIKSIEKINNNQSIITKSCIDMSYNLCQVGACILSYSKRIMNEIFDIANDNNIDIYYTDTDSMHLPYDDIRRLERLYSRKYNKQLTGSYLGHFHSDFKLKGAVGDVYSIKSLFLAKKCYIDILEGNDENNNKVNGVHYRLKGITNEGIEYETKKNFNGYHIELYKHLINNEVEFTQNPNDKYMLSYVNKHAVTRSQNEYKVLIKV